MSEDRFAGWLEDMLKAARQACSYVEGTAKLIELYAERLKTHPTVCDAVAHALHRRTVPPSPVLPNGDDDGTSKKKTAASRPPFLFLLLG